MSIKQMQEVYGDGVPNGNPFQVGDSELSILKAIAEGAPADEIFDRVVRRIESLLPGATGSLLRLDPATGKLRHVAAPHLPESYLKEVGDVTPGPRVGSCGTAAWLGEAVFANDIATDPNWESGRELALKHGLRCCWSAPVLSSDGTLLGTVAIYHTEPREWTRADMDEIESVLHLCSLAMQHVCTREALQERNRLIHGTAESLEILITEDDISVAVPRVLEILGEAADVDRVYFFEYHDHPETGESVTSQRAEWVRGEVEAQIGHEGMQNFRMADLVPEIDAKLRSGESVSVIVADLEGAAREFLAEQDIRSLLVVPVVLDSVWGFIGFDDCRRERRWSQIERAVLCSTAGALGTAFVRARTADELVTANQRFERVTANVPGVIFQSVLAADGSLTFNYLSEGGSSVLRRDLTVLKEHPELLETIIHPADQPGFWSSISESITNDHLWEWEGRGFDEAGEIHWISAVGNHSTQEDGSTLWHGLFMDVTEHREGQRALELSEQRLSALFENALDAILLADDHARYIDANPAACSLLGYTREELLGLTIADLVAPEDAEEALVGWKLFIETGTIEGEFELLRSDRSTVVAEFSARASILPGVHLSILRDVTLRKQAEDALIESEARFRKLAESAPVIIWVTDVNRHTTYISEQWPEFTGRDLEDVLGHGWINCLHPEDQPRTEAALRIAAEARGMYETEYRVRRADGEYRWMAARGVPRYDSKGVFLGYIGTSMDIHDRKLYEQELVEARRRAEESDHLKSILLTNMSHEIRTPLTAIIGFTDILAEEVDQRHTELVDHVRLGAERLFETLNSVLDFAQLEAGAAEIGLDAVGLDAVVDQSVSLFGARAQAKGLELRTNLPSEQVTALANQSALGRVVSNLVSNAIKFTSVGHIEVGARTVGDAVELWVSDTGRGISPDFLPILFDAFRQESEGTSRDFEGSGLGLAITKKLVNAMDGTIEVDSDSSGTTFTVRMQRFGPARAVRE